MADLMADHRTCVCWMVVMVMALFGRGCIVDGIYAPQYQPTAADPILSDVMNELSAAKSSLESTRQQLVDAESSIAKLFDTVTLNDQNSEKQPKGFGGHKLVHLDLSGAPPKLTYLLELIPFVRSWGATGFLVEYVDTFPFRDELKILRSSTAYSENDISEFLQKCDANGMVVIPLIQTFGHLEYVLKFEEFAHLRETERYTNSLCPQNNGSLILVKKMIDQIVSLHPDSSWLHVGGDEVWNLKTCKNCKATNQSDEEIFLSYMTPVLTYVKQKNKTAIMWDDMMRDWKLEQLKYMSKLVEPMLWGYRTPLSQHFPEGVFQRYGAAFPRVWMASAFKGAYKSDANFVRINIRLENNLEWVRAANQLSQNTTVMGLALTGWSRYDYFGTLCELLPASIPSLAICLTAVNQGFMNENLLANISRSLGFRKTIDLNADYNVPSICDGSFPGHKVYKMVCKLSVALHKMDLAIDTKNTWTLPRQLNSNTISFFRLKFGRSMCDSCINILTELGIEAEGPLSAWFSNSTLNEWLSDKIEQNLLKAQALKRHFENVEMRYNKLFKQKHENKTQESDDTAKDFVMLEVIQSRQTHESKFSDTGNVLATNQEEEQRFNAINQSYRPEEIVENLGNSEEKHREDKYYTRIDKPGVDDKHNQHKELQRPQVNYQIG